MEGRLRVLRYRDDLATVTVDFSKPQPAADDELPGFLAGLRGGWRALRTTAIVGSAVVEALLPWLVPAVLLPWPPASAGAAPPADPPAPADTAS